MSIDKNLRTKRNQTVTVLALILILAFSTFAAYNPLAMAHDPPWELDTWTYVVVSPDIVGVGQTTWVVFWLNYVPPTAVGASGDRWSFNVEVTKPDGTTETIGPVISDPVGNGYISYTPDAVGTYQFKAIFPGYTITNENPHPSGTTGVASIGDIYKPSTSETVELKVQQDRVADIENTPLPTDYWERPIEGQNRDWWTISGNWYAPNGYNQSQGYYYKGGGFNPYTTGPGSAHIVWKQPLEMFGGIIGGDQSIDGGVGSYYNGMSYEQAFAPPVIIQGRLYYTTPPSAKPNYGTHCVDIRTGEEIWYQNITINYGQVYNYISPNQFGGIPYLWSTSGTTYSLYDAYTGNWILDLENATTRGTIEFAEDGSMLAYFHSNSGWFAMWNSSLAIWANMPNLWSGNNYWLWRPPQGQVLDWTKGIQWNVTVPEMDGRPSIYRVNGEVAILRSKISENGLYIAQDMGISADPPTAGNVLWGPLNRTAQPSLPFSTAPMADGIYTDFIGETMSWIGYSIYTGEKLWGPSPSTTNAFAMYGAFRTLFAAYGKIYQIGMDGAVHCIDLTNGEVLWDFNTGSSGTETNYGQWPLLSAGFLGGAPGTGGLRIYATGGHTHLQPLFRGSEMYAIDGETGNLLWSIYGWWQAGSAVGADGYLLAVNGYDNQLYCFGKGKTAVTVTAPQTLVPKDQPVLISGTVTDLSPAQPGTHAVSDESMSSWMEYLNMQKTKPTDVTGVPVHLTAIDPNGNFQDIGYTTSNALGNYAIDWIPPVPGLYTVTAAFEGSNSYFGSEAGAAFVVSEATVAAPVIVSTQPPTSTDSTDTPAVSTPLQPVSPSPSEVPQPPTSTMPTTTYIAIGTAIIIIVAAATALALKRRK
ncbi:MAG: PQQ-binding-like beta-propeller repeat protein [Candidatus Bathyarchaeota archaeon]|nr:PQQ-binding-like beta-propeller repeat protein [Candidatus Bathyarchaeota archaeon]